MRFAINAYLNFFKGLLYDPVAAILSSAQWIMEKV